MARVNFIDLRSGIYAFQPGEKLDKAEITEALKQAHLRGLIVFATVNCGVSSNQYEKVMGTSANCWTWARMGCGCRSTTRARAMTRWR